jgi:hypothetical protein
MSSIRQFRAFSTEMMKVAADVQDSDIRALLAERRGKEYLQGGRLLSNSAVDGSQYAVKMGSGGYTPPLGLDASGAYNHSSKVKKHNQYQKARDYTGTAIKGGLTGLGILAGHNAMKGRFGSPQVAHEIAHAARQARHAASAGAGIAVADKAYRHDDLPKMAFVNQTSGASFRSPSAELASTQATGSFHGGSIHNTGHAPQALQLGKKFRMP